MRVNQICATFEDYFSKGNFSWKFSFTESYITQVQLIKPFYDIGRIHSQGMPLSQIICLYYQCHAPSCVTKPTSLSVPGQDGESKIPLAACGFKTRLDFPPGFWLLRRNS